MRLILRHFWHEIRWCFAVSSGFQKGCLAVAFLLSTLVDGSSSRSSSSTRSSSSSSSQNWISSKISEGTFRPPRSVLLQLILHHFWREIGWCFAVSSGFRKGCLAVVFLLLAAAAAAAAAVTSSQQQLLVSSFRGLLIAAAAAAAAGSSSSHQQHQQQQQQPPAAAVKI